MAIAYITGKIARYQYGYEQGRFSILADSEKLKGNSLVSPRDPAREAVRHIGTFHLKPGMLALVAGVAHIPMLELLVEQVNSSKGKGGLIIAFEADTELYLALKNLRPEIFSQIAVIVPENLTVLSELVENLDIENFVGYRAFENKGSVDLDATFYAQAITDFKKKLASRFSDFFTRIEFEERWVFNSLSKLPLFYRARPVSSLFGLGRSSQALMISTGPSLRSSLADLKKNKNEYFIACADSAYRVLVRSGIIPHLVFSLDSQAHTAKHFALLPKGKKGQFPLLVCDAVSNPCVARDWQGELVISFTAQYPENFRAGDSVSGVSSTYKRVVSPGCDFIEEEKFLAGTPGMIPGDLQSGGSVATSIFDLLRLMQFDRIILVGQDLAYTHREIHTSGTHHTDEWLAKTTNRLQPLENINERVIRRRNTKRELSLTGKPIVTDYVLSLYRDWFTTAIARMPKIIFNATQDGLMISSAQRLSKLPQIESGANEQILKKFLATKYLEVHESQIATLSERILSALHKKDNLKNLSFLRYVGRKFTIKAMRDSKNKEALLAKQSSRQRNFLNKMSLKFYNHG